MPTTQPHSASLPTHETQCVRIFDFDQTLTIHHTFQFVQGIMAQPGPTDYIEVGYRDSETNTKKGLAETGLFNIEDHNLFVIATYHNNPDYIAGYMQRILGKSVKPALAGNGEPIIYYSNAPVIAIKEYRVDGMEKPLMIAYIPLTGPEFSAHLGLLEGKNHHIAFLKEKMLEKGLIKADTPFALYDDTQTHCNKAIKLPFVLATHTVSSKQEYFQVIACMQPSDIDDVKRKATPNTSGAAASSDAAVAVEPTLPTLEQAKSLLLKAGFLQSSEFLDVSSPHSTTHAFPNRLLLVSHPGAVIATYYNGKEIKEYDVTQFIATNIAEFSSVAQAVKCLNQQPGQATGEALHGVIHRDEFLRLEGAKKIARMTGLIHSASTLSDTDSETLARKFPGHFILRESPTTPAVLFATAYKNGQVYHYDLAQLIQANITQFTHPDAIRACLNEQLGQCVLPLEETKMILRTSGLVHKNLSRQDSEILVQGNPDYFILRESSSIPGMIAVTYKTLEGTIKHDDITPLIEQNRCAINPERSILDKIQEILLGKAALSPPGPSSTATILSSFGGDAAAASMLPAPGSSSTRAAVDAPAARVDEDPGASEDQEASKGQGATHFRP